MSFLFQLIVHHFYYFPLTITDVNPIFKRLNLGPSILLWGDGVLNERLGDRLQCSEMSTLCPLSTAHQL